MYIFTLLCSLNMVLLCIIFLNKYISLVKEVTIDVSDSLMPGEKRSELLSQEMNPGPLN